MFAVTLKQLRDANACVDGYNKVVCMLSGEEFDPKRETYMRFRHEGEISLIDIANNNGIDDALWATRCLIGKDRDLRLYAVWCARQVPYFMKDKRSIESVNVAERFANGRATSEELAAARDAARADKRDSSWAATRAAAWDAAWSATWADALDAEKDAQKQMFINMCNGTAPWQVEK